MCSSDLVLLFLSQNGKQDTASDIVRKLKITKSHVSASVRDLEERGYLQGTYAGRDHRTIHLQLCGNAAEIIREGERVQKEFLSIVSQDFTEDEKKAFAGFIRRMNDNANQYLQKQLHS